ncbi:MAG: D-glycero-alpha-D-manno-heptose-1,7-bisphosphate 7-phosphatase [Candidatus Eiseniibacteriota bacterium]
MRVTVVPSRFALSASRLELAAAGLAGRGHQVVWCAPPLPPAPAPGEPGPEVLVGTRLALPESDVVVAGADRAALAALVGWRSRTHAMVLAVAPAPLSRWSVLDRLGWHSLYSLGLLEERDAEAMRADSHGLELERLALWSGGTPPDAPEAEHPDTEVLERACERALARHRARARRGAVFLDRDGTLVVERGYLSDPAELELLPGVPGALAALRGAGYALVVISNQSGVGRGLFPRSRVYQAMARLRLLLRAQHVELDAIYFCPHRPGDDCDCRKPRSGLLERAADDLALDLGRSFMVGDKLIDAEAGRRAGGHGLLLRTGYGRDEERRLTELAGGAETAPLPDAVVDDLPAAVRWILAKEESAEVD